MPALPFENHPPGHPVDTFVRENVAAAERAAKLRELVGRVDVAAAGDDLGNVVIGLRQTIAELADLDKHYLRKEGLVFPLLESYGITGPSTVMWGQDDDVREKIMEADRALAAENLDRQQLLRIAEITIDSVVQEVERMIRREEEQLLPMALNTFTETDWGEVWRGSPRYGWCLVEPATGYEPPPPAEDSAAAAAEARPVVFDTGCLTADQLRALFPTMPLDFSFVDADDRVRFYSLGPEPIFVRTKTDLGRPVQQCHPAEFVPKVNRILADLRAGRHDVVESWIDHKGRFVHIRYLAVRNEQGQYLGCLEMVQDLTPMRELTGQCRLKQYDDSDAESS